MSKLSAAEYRQSQSRDITLPSGFTITCRKPFLDRMLGTYNLRPKYMEMLRAVEAARQEPDETTRAALAAANADDAFALNCALICDAAIDPPLDLQPGGGSLCVQELSPADWNHLSGELWAWLGLDLKGAGELAPFRQPDSDSGAGGEVQDAAEQAAEQPGLTVV